MTKNKWFMIGGFFFTMTVGSIFHFMFDWLGRPWFLRWLFPVSESVPQHFKLLIFPNLIYAGLLSPVMQKLVKGYWIRIIAGIMAGVASIQLLFCLYMRILKKDNFYMDLLVFTVSTGLSYAFFVKKDVGNFVKYK